jgi:GT2 family glycosyltransferase
VTVGAVVLTQGRRPAQLDAALRSVLEQRGVAVDVAVVGNGWEPAGLPAGVRSVALSTDRGIPAGRNAGAPHVAGDLLLFLDDDAALGSPDVLARVAARFAAEPDLGLLQLRVVPDGDGAPPRDWVPRLRVGDRARSSDVAAVWEGAVVMPRSVFEQVGGWPEAFRFAHEGIDLAWRVMDTGRRVHYAGDVTVRHAPYATAPHDARVYYGARNRVWLARRHLPAALGVLYVASFALRTLPVLHTRARARAALRGYRDGLRQSAGERRVLRPRTIWRMTRIGRPPVI